MTQQEYKEQVIDINKNKHRPLLETLVEGRKQFMKQSKTDKNNVIIYYSSAKLPETTGTTDNDKGIHTNKFSGKNGNLTITNHTFENGIGTIEFNNDVTVIGTEAFYYCDSMTGIDLPNSITTIGEDAFKDCRSLTSITIPNSVTSIGEGAFEWCFNLVSVNNFPNSMTIIPRVIFNGCSKLSSFTIPDNVTTIGYAAFSQCKSLVIDNIPNSVTTIGEAAFNDCKGITSITIGSGIQYISKEAFQQCSSLGNITILATTAPSIHYKTFFFIKSNGTLHVPTGSTGYNTWMQNEQYYLGYYGWTKIEQ